MTREDKIYELEQRIAYYNNQALMLNHKDHLSDFDYKWLNDIRLCIDGLSEWINDLRRNA